jgi:hypothetical protein
MYRNADERPVESRSESRARERLTLRELVRQLEDENAKLRSTAFGLVVLVLALGGLAAWWYALLSKVR